MMWGYGSGATVWWMVGESLIWVLVVVAVVVGVILLMRGEFKRRVAALNTSLR